MIRVRFQSGSAQLLTALVAGAIGAVAAVFLSKMMVSNFRATASLSLSEDLLAVRRRIDQELSCEKTLAGINLTGPTCSAGSTTPLTLRDRNGNALTEPLLTTGVGAGSGKMAGWHVRTTCDGPNGTLSILAARPEGASFMQDPFTKRTYDWSTNKKELYGASSGLKLCSGMFGGGSVPLTPKGLCEIRKKFVTTSSPLMPNHVHRSESIYCATQRPVLMSINIVPSCYGSDWACSIYNNAKGVPYGGGCAIIFMPQNPSLTPSEKAAKQTECDGLGQPTDLATIQGVCCDF